MNCLVGVAFALFALQLLGSAECRPEIPAKQKQIIFTKVDYEAKKGLITMSLNLKNSTNGIPTVDLEAELFEDIPNDLYITNVIARRQSEMDYMVIMKTGRTNLCDLFKNPDREPFLKAILGTLDKFGRMMYKCPVTKGRYYLNDFYLEASALPSFTPTGDYRVDFSITHKEKDAYVPIYKMIWYATITQ